MTIDEFLEMNYEKSACSCAIKTVKSVDSIDTFSYFYGNFYGNRKKTEGQQTPSLCSLPSCDWSYTIQISSATVYRNKMRLRLQR